MSKIILPLKVLKIKNNMAFKFFVDLQGFLHYWCSTTNQLARIIYTIIKLPGCRAARKPITRDKNV